MGGGGWKVVFIWLKLAQNSFKNDAQATAEKSRSYTDVVITILCIIFKGKIKDFTKQRQKTAWGVLYWSEILKMSFRIFF